MTILLDGKSLSEKIITSLKDDIVNLKIKPGLTVILVGEDKASEIYVKNKERVSKKIGINSNVIRLPKDIEESDLLKIIDKLNNDESINATSSDILLYQGRYMVIMYGSNSWSYTRLGKITGFSNSEIYNILSKAGNNIKIYIK